MKPLVRTEMQADDQEELNKLFGSSSLYDGFAHFTEKKYTLQRSVYTDLEQSLRSVPIRKDDVWIGGFSRSGTHWLAELTWLLCNNLDFEKAKAILHEERIFYYDFNPKSMFQKIVDGKLIIEPRGPETFFNGLPSPRFFKTHFPLSLLPSTLLQTTKMVYVARDPRDVAVSCYHFYKNHKFTQYNGDFKSFWKHFMKGNIFYGPYFENVKEFWNVRNHPNLLFLFYEELHKDLQAAARRVAKFFGRNYSDDDFKRLCDHLNFNNMKKNKAINCDKMLGDQSEEVVRKGIAGGWRDEFDDEMIKASEVWFAEQLKNTDLRFPSMK